METNKISKIPLHIEVILTLNNKIATSTVSELVFAD